ncbi:MAG: hypothetical protein PHW02_03515 [bacterium]|nr:hypothetical protein [bacterium]
MNKTATCLIILTALLSFGCFTENDEDAIKKVIMANTEAMNREDLSGYMSTIYNDGSENYKSLEKMLGEIFNAYDIKMSVVSVDVVEITGNTAKARTKTVTNLEGNLPNKNSRATSLHYMIKDNKTWKIQNTVNEEVSYSD